MATFTPIAPLPFMYENGGEISILSTTSFSVNSGQFRSSDNSNDIVITSPITITTTSFGINGLDTGTFAASTQYAVFAVMDATDANPSGYILSLSDTAPILPNPYSLIRRVGYVWTDGSTHFVIIRQYGNRNERLYILDTEVQVYSGAGTGGSTYALQSLAAVVPATARRVRLTIGYGANSVSDVMHVRPAGSVSVNHDYMQNDAATNSASHYLETDCNSAQAVEWLSTSTSDTVQIWVTGFTDYI